MREEFVREYSRLCRRCGMVVDMALGFECRDGALRDMSAEDVEGHIEDLVEEVGGIVA